LEAARLFSLIRSQRLVKLPQKIVFMQGVVRKKFLVREQCSIGAIVPAHLFVTFETRSIRQNLLAKVAGPTAQGVNLLI
jgi:hypothetical protein